MINYILLQHKEIQGVKNITSGYNFGFGDHNVWININYSSFWKLPKSFKFESYDTANKFIVWLEGVINGKIKTGYSGDYYFNYITSY